MQDCFSHIVGHDRVLQLLRQALAHPGQAYLFHGPDGAGKRTVARAFASALLKLDTDKDLAAHPDFIRITREEGSKQITVDSARELVNRLSMSAAAAGYKVALIEGAEYLNISAVNALLKAVEEPPKGVVYIFITEEFSGLPATLRSRLAPLSFGRVPAADIKSWLEARGLENSLAASLAAAAYGLPGLALRSSENQEQLTVDQADTQELLRVLRESSIGECVAALESMAKACDSEADPEAAWRKRLSDLMRLAFQTGVPTDQARVAEGVILAWHYVGSALSPRLGLEWTAIRPYRIGNHLIPSCLLPTYL